MPTFTHVIPRLTRSPYWNQYECKAGVLMRPTWRNYEREKFVWEHCVRDITLTQWTGSNHCVHRRFSGTTTSRSGTGLQKLLTFWVDTAATSLLRPSSLLAPPFRSDLCLTTPTRGQDSRFAMKSSKPVRYFDGRFLDDCLLIFGGFAYWLLEVVIRRNYRQQFCLHMVAVMRSNVIIQYLPVLF